MAHVEHFGVCALDQFALRHQWRNNTGTLQAQRYTRNGCFKNKHKHNRNNAKNKPALPARLTFCLNCPTTSIPRRDSECQIQKHQQHQQTTREQEENKESEKKEEAHNTSNILVLFHLQLSIVHSLLSNSDRDVLSKIYIPLSTVSHEPPCARLDRPTLERQRISLLATHQYCFFAAYNGAKRGSSSAVRRVNVLTSTISVCYSDASVSNETLIQR